MDTQTQDNSTFQDISFSSYLKPKDPTPNSQESDTEISIFDAHKYFNETNNLKDIRTQQTSHDSLSVPRLSSVSSDGLLANPADVNLHSNRRAVLVSAAKKWFFQPKCCCSGKKSVQVKQVYEQRKPVVLINKDNKANYLHTKRGNIMEIQQNKISLLPQSISSLYQSSKCRISSSGRRFIDGQIDFTFPIVNPRSDKGIMAKPLVKPLEDPSMDNPIAKPTRKPLQDPSMDNPIAKPIYKPLQDPSMDNPGIQMSPDEDVGSDASSDLFEIESFSNQTTLYRRNASSDEEPACNANGINNDNIQSGGKILDEMPEAASVAATECYPPGEVTSSSEIGKVDVLGQRMEEAGDDGGKMKLGNNRAAGLGQQAVAESPPVLSLNVDGK